MPYFAEGLHQDQFHLPHRIDHRRLVEGRRLRLLRPERPPLLHGLQRPLQRLRLRFERGVQRIITHMSAQTPNSTQASA